MLGFIGRNSFELSTMLAYCLLFLLVVLTGCQCVVTDDGGKHRYSTAYAAAISDQKPLVVLVSATWCPPCRKFKANVLPELKKDGVLDAVELALVDVDNQPELADKINDGMKGIPLLVIFAPIDGGTWRRVAVENPTYKSVKSAIARHAKAIVRSAPN